MNIIDIIVKKRDGGKLSREEINYFIRGCVDGSIPDYQSAALLMAVFLRGMDEEETFFLTHAMAQSGDVLDLSNIPGIKIDKHSTGGVGDKTTPVVVSIAAAAGVPVAKMSGRGLGFTGGTVDKLQSIPGFQVVLDEDRFMDQVRTVGAAVIAQSGNLTPADKKLYALRDVTGTVENLSLISSSIMSKKLAAGSDGIVLDVKCGDGAFMKTPEDAVKLAETMISIGRSAGKKMSAVISDMDQPLGRAVGNSVEIREAIEVLQGAGPDDVRELCLELASEMIRLGEKAEDHQSAMAAAREMLDSGRALEKFGEMIRAQGGDPGVIRDASLLPEGTCRTGIRAGENGFITAIRGQEIGEAARLAGAGRLRKEDDIDKTAGVILHAKVGDHVEKGQLLAEVFGSIVEKTELAAEKCRKAFVTGSRPPAGHPLIYRVLR